MVQVQPAVPLASNRHGFDLLLPNTDKERSEVMGGLSRASGDAAGELLGQRQQGRSRWAVRPAGACGRMVLARAASECGWVANTLFWGGVRTCTSGASRFQIPSQFKLAKGNSWFHNSES